MQSEKPGAHAAHANYTDQAPLPGSRDDDGENRVLRVRVAPRSLLLPAGEDNQDEDNQTEHEQLATRLRDRFLRTAFEQAAVGIAFVSPQGPWLHVNQRVCELLGYNRAELVALTWWDLTYPDDRATSTAYVQRLLAGDLDEYELDKRYIRKDGAPVWTHLTVSLVRTPGGEPDYFISTLQDVAERKRLERERAQLLEQERAARLEAEAALARAVASETHLRTILETIADGVAVYDAEGRPVQLVNRAYRELFALDRGPAEYEDLPTFDRASLVQVRDATTGALLPFVRTPVGRALTGEVVMGPSADICVRTFDGRELELNSSAAPLRDPDDGRVAGAVLVLRDMTWRKQLAREREAARAQAERQAGQLDRIFEATADGLVVYDAAGQLVRANVAARRILGLDAAPPGFDQLPLLERLARYAARDEQGRPVPPEEQPFLRVIRGEVRSQTGAETRDLRIRALDGREIELTFTVAPLRDREGHIMGAVSAFRDQTERNRLEREREAARADELAAREASRRMDEFLAIATHELRSPVMSSALGVELVSRRVRRLRNQVPSGAGALDDQLDEIQSLVTQADQSVAQLSRLVVDLLDVSRLRGGQLAIWPRPSDLATIVREVVARQRHLTPHRTITLRLPATLPVPVVADADRIGQVVTNYLTNALKYAPEDQPVDVRLHVRGDRARVSVRDHGPGLPKEEQRRIWERYHQAPGIEANAGTGVSLGLGLYIGQTIVERHGGQVGVHSVPGKGATFWFELPLQRDAIE